jgi:hypothetical protein
VRDSAQRAIAAGRSEEADRALVAFARRHPNSPEGRESIFWRALLLLDPTSAAGPGAAANAFDAYLAGGDPSHRDEALALRIVAGHLDSLTRTRKSAAEGVASSDHADAARDEELKKLRLELKATQEELDRIKRRLTAPKP